MLQKQCKEEIISKGRNVTAREEVRNYCTENKPIN